MENKFYKVNHTRKIILIVNYLKRRITIKINNIFFILSALICAQVVANRIENREMYFKNSTGQTITTSSGERIRSGNFFKEIVPVDLNNIQIQSPITIVTAPVAIKVAWHLSSTHDYMDYLMVQVNNDDKKPIELDSMRGYEHVFPYDPQKFYINISSNFDLTKVRRNISQQFGRLPVER